MVAKKETTRYRSTMQEEYIAKLLGGTRQANSGASRFNKGDVIVGDWLIEAKTTMTPKTSFAIKKEWIIKNELERMEMHKPHSALVFQFEPNGTNYFVIDEALFKKMLVKFEGV